MTKQIKKRGTYVKPELTVVQSRLSSMLLANSLTDHPVTIESVQVVDFEKDSSFGTDGTWDIQF